MITSIDCVTACFDASAACMRCVNQTFEYDSGDIQRMPTACIECADICEATARVVTVEGVHSAQLCSLCADVCEWCAEECQKHDNEHCSAGVPKLLECARVCRQMFD